MIYFITDGRGAVKIGRSRHPKVRMRDLQVANPNKLRMVLALPGGAREERGLHHRFGEYRIQGEWFRCEGELRTFMAEKYRQPESRKYGDYAEWGGGLPTRRREQYQCQHCGQIVVAQADGDDLTHGTPKITSPKRDRPGRPHRGEKQQKKRRWRKCPAYKGYKKLRPVPDAGR